MDCGVNSLDLRLQLIRLQLKLTGLLEHYPALALLMFYGFGRLQWLGLTMALMLIGACRPEKVKAVMLILLLLVGWGAQREVNQSEDYWNKCLKQHGFLHCMFRWEKDVYQQIEQQEKQSLNDEKLQGWAKVWPMDHNEHKGHVKRMWVNVPTSSLENNESWPSYHFSGAQWQGWLAIWPERSLVFANTSIMEDSKLLGWLAWRRWIIVQLESSWKNLDPEARGLLRSLLTGHRSELTPALQHDFQRLGLMALLAISGLHLALLFGFVMWMGRRWTLTRWIALSLALGYAMLGGWNVPLFRSWGMLALCVASEELRRAYSSINALAFMALLEHIADPYAHLSLSFQLSYLGVLGILWMLSLPWQRLNLRSADVIFKAYLCSWGAMLWTWPIGLATFGNLPSWGWLFGPLCFSSFGLLLAYVLLLGGVSLFITLPAWSCTPILWYNSILTQLSSWSSWITSAEAGDPRFLICYYVGLMGLSVVWRRESHARFQIY